MVWNIIQNLPPKWKVQIFYTGKGQAKFGIDINPGLTKLINRGDVILTTIPRELSKIKTKPKEMMTELWLWENVLAQKVLVFGGNQVICSNSVHKIEDFLQWDYLGYFSTTFSPYLLLTKNILGHLGILLKVSEVLLCYARLYSTLFYLM